MKKISRIFSTILSSGTHQGLSENKKFAIQMANFDGLLSIVTFLYYSILSINSDIYPLKYIHPAFILVVAIGMFLIKCRSYDTGRVLIHLNGIAAVFITADCFHSDTGYEFYYFIGMTIPFITFSMEEHWKGTLLSIVTGAVLVVQESIGTGKFMKPLPVSPDAKMEALVVVMGYLILIFAVTRWRLHISQKQIAIQQGELVHNSNLIALGEMSSGIAHEINNPLQALSLQVEILRRELRLRPDYTGVDLHQLTVIDRIIRKVSKMVNGLKDLSRDVSQDPKEAYPIGVSLDDVLNISSEKLNALGINFEISGDQNIMIYGHSVQMAQVILNLINNSIDAVTILPERWIKIDVKELDKKLVLRITDSGKGIPEDVVQKMMKPFFTTKDPSKGTGLGLSISGNILTKDGGALIYDSKCPNTSFVIEYPLLDNLLP